MINGLRYVWSQYGSTSPTRWTRSSRFRHRFADISTRNPTWKLTRFRPKSRPTPHKAMPWAVWQHTTFQILRLILTHSVMGDSVFFVFPLKSIHFHGNSIWTEVIILWISFKTNRYMIFSIRVVFNPPQSWFVSQPCMKSAIGFHTSSLGRSLGFTQGSISSRNASKSTSESGQILCELLTPKTSVPS